MVSVHFFPKLTRKNEEYYHNSRGEFYSDYKLNYANIAIDCLHRCVYCDVTEKECGGDKFSLDHFRPRLIFASKFDGILLKHPYNLFLSCQKCNVLKSSDWQGCTNTVSGPSYYGKVGYINRFESDILAFLDVNNSGEVYSIDENGPADYIIKKLLLNRPNRIYIRRKRIFNLQMKSFQELYNKKFDHLLHSLKKGLIGEKEALTLVEKLLEIKKELDLIS